MGKITKKIIENVPNPNIDLTKTYGLVRKVNELVRKSKVNNGFDYIVKTSESDVPIRIFYPKNKPLNLIIYYHGGGWIMGNIDTYNRPCSELALSTDSIVISIDYRLAPENKFPKGFNDCYEVTDIIYKSVKMFKLSKRKIVLMGDSAGGNIAACISLRRRDEKKYIPKKQVLLYPATSAIHDLEEYNSIKEHRNNISLSYKQLEAYVELYKNSDEDLKNPYFAPLNATSLKRQPKSLILVADLDILRDEGIEYANSLYDARNKVYLYRMDDEGHGYFTSFKNTKAIRKTYSIINDFLKGWL